MLTQGQTLWNILPSNAMADLSPLRTLSRSFLAGEPPSNKSLLAAPAYSEGRGHGCGQSLNDTSRHSRTGNGRDIGMWCSFFLTTLDLHAPGQDISTNYR